MGQARDVEESQEIENSSNKFYEDEIVAHL